MPQGKKGTAKARKTNTTNKIRVWISLDKDLYEKVDKSREVNDRTMTGEIVFVLKNYFK